MYLTEEMLSSLLFSVDWMYNSTANSAMWKLLYINMSVFVTF